MNDERQVPILNASSLKKTFVTGDEKLEILRDINLTLLKGETVSIRGESGSGKSTLLNILGGLDKPDSGELFWEGACDTGARRRARFLGIVFQSFCLIPELNAMENVLLAGRVAGLYGKESLHRAKMLLNRVGLEDRIKHLPGKLSGGERQRVALARALINSPKLILADEPTGNLDEKTGDIVIDLLLEICHETETSLLLVTHNAAHAKRTDRQLFLRNGILCED